jgi:uncharacterized phage-associated protein
MYDVRAIANWFLDRAERNGEQLTAMKLQKLAYVAHGWYLAFADKPLVHDAVEAWKWGPVFRSLYREFRDYGSKPITRRATAFDGATLEDREIGILDYANPEEMDRYLESVWKVYGKYTASQLSSITHQEGTPWHQMYKEMGDRILPYAVIPNSLIADHYKRLLHERQPSTNSAG